MVDEFVDALSNDPDYPDVVFVHQGTIEQGESVFGPLVGQVKAIADTGGELYGSFGIERGGMKEMFGLRSWKRGLQATAKGYFIGRKVGDGWTLPTMFAIEGDRIVWEHRGVHAGDHPVVGMIPELVAAQNTGSKQ